MVGGRDLKGLLLRSSPSPLAQAELKLAPAEQSACVRNMKADGNINLEFPLQDRPEFSEVVSNLEECLCNVEVHNSRPICHTPVECPQISKINHLTLHASVCLAADVSGLQQQQRLAVALLFL